MTPRLELRIERSVDQIKLYEEAIVKEKLRLDELRLLKDIRDGALMVQRPDGGSVSLRYFG